jgi:acyl-CoA thioester hydrolase
MYVSTTNLRVRYAETDQMGYAYYGNYSIYYEVARVDALRQMGLNYKEIEEGGIMLPVLSLNIKFIKPAFYDDLLTIKTVIKELPTARISFNYEIFNEAGDILNKGDTTLVFINMATKKPCAAPAFFIDRIKKYFPS